MSFTREQERAIHEQIRRAYPPQRLTLRDWLAGLSELVYPLFLAVVLSGWVVVLMLTLA